MSPNTRPYPDEHLTGAELAFAMEYHGAELDDNDEPYYTPDYAAECDKAPGEFLEKLLY